MGLLSLVNTIKLKIKKLEKSLKEHYKSYSQLEVFHHQLLK